MVDLLLQQTPIGIGGVFEMAVDPECQKQKQPENQVRQKKIDRLDRDHLLASIFFFNSGKRHKMEQ